MARGQETSYKRRRLAEEPDTERTIILQYKAPLRAVDNCL